MTTGYPTHRFAPPPARAARPGFTLLELLMALVLTAIAVTIAAGALRAANTAGDRVQAHRDTLERESRLRSLLTDMLRHAPSAELVDEPLLSLVPASMGATQLVFLSKGVRAPYGTGPVWRVSLSLQPEGLVLDATPIGATRETTTLRTVLPDVDALSVLVRERGSTDNAAVSGGNRAGVPSTDNGQRGGWRPDWPLQQSRPALIALHFGRRDRQPMAPFVVALDPLAAGSRP